jgi:hypothetical protein
MLSQLYMKISRMRVPGNSGSLCQFVQVKKNKLGESIEYPKVEGERDPRNIDHYFWCYSFKEKVQDKFLTRSKSVPRSKVQIVRDLIAKSIPTAEILVFLE